MAQREAMQGRAGLGIRSREDPDALLTDKLKEPSQKKKRLKEGGAPEGCSPFMAQFEVFSKSLDAINEKRERLVKLSRDTTMASKKVIFLLHRLTPATKTEILETATKDLGSIANGFLRRIGVELGHQEEGWRFHRAFSPGVQEYVEAATFAHYCSTGEVASMEILNRKLRWGEGEGEAIFGVQETDYLLGLGDLTGELMRLAINGVAKGEGEMAAQLKRVVREIHGGFLTLTPSPALKKEMGKKMETMLQSLVKIETASYTVRVRGSEFPDADLGALLERATQRTETGSGVQEE